MLRIRSIPRVRLTPGLVLSALVLGAWLFTWLASVSLETSRFSLGLHDGRGYLLIFSKDIAEYRASLKRTPLILEAAHPGGPWTERPLWPSWKASCTGTRYLVIPLWCVLAAVGLPTALVRGRELWRMVFRRHGCRKCGYSLAGLAPGALCPECGTSTAPVATGAGP